MAPVFAG